MPRVSLFNQQIFERIVRAPDGRLFCVRFVVVERDGVFRGKVISCKQIYAIRTANKIRKYEQTRRRFYSPFTKGSTRVREGEGFYLPVFKLHQPVEDKGLRITDYFPSPYFNKFDFLTVIKIRAPSGDAGRCRTNARISKANVEKPFPLGVHEEEVAVR